MSLTKAFKTDKTKEIEGVAIKMPANEDGTIPTFIVSRLGRSNQRYTRALERIMKPHAAAVRTKTLSNDMADKLLRQAFIEGALITWQNVKMADVTGDESQEGDCTFTPAGAAELFDHLPELYETLSAEANDVSLFREGTAEADAKN